MIFSSIYKLRDRIEHLEKHTYRDQNVIKFSKSAEFQNFVSELKESLILSDKNYIRLDWQDDDVIYCLFNPKIICSKASVFNAVFESADPTDFYFFESEKGEIPYYSVSVEYNGLIFKCAEEWIDDAYIIKLKTK